MERFDEKRFLELYDKGFTASRIATEMGVRRETVNRHRRRLGLPLCVQPDRVTRRVAGNALRRVSRDDVAELAGQGLTNNQIADRMGIADRTVSRILGELGMSRAIRDFYAYPSTIRERARMMLEDGASYNEVGRTLGVRSGTVRKWFPGLGWSYSQAAQYRKMVERLDLLDNPAGPRVYS